MAKNEKELFKEIIYTLVAKIPEGKVATYGQLAVLAGHPNWSRMAGKVLANASGRSLPCHRVVNSSGRTVPGWSAQVQLLKNEGVSFKNNGNVDMKLHRWVL